MRKVKVLNDASEFLGDIMCEQVIHHIWNKAELHGVSGSGFKKIQQWRKNGNIRTAGGARIIRYIKKA